MKKIVCLLIIFFLIPIQTYAKGSVSSGGRGGGFSSGSRSSSSRTSSATSSSTRSTTTRSVSSTPSKPTVSKTPSASTPYKTATTNKTVGGKNFGKKGYVVGDGYSPKFKGGYTAPAGSVVYRRESSMMDWLPFYLIWSSSNSHRDAVVVTEAKDGQPATETVVKEEGIDGMYVWNWIISILLIIGLIAGIMYLVNKYTTKKYE